MQRRAFGYSLQARLYSFEGDKKSGRHQCGAGRSPEIAEAREATLKAIEEAEAGWQKAIDKIAKRAGLTKGPDGTWRDPSMSVAA